MSLRSFARNLVLVSLALAWPCSALAAFPEKPITLIVTYSAGGEADVQTRIVARHLEKEFGVPFVIKNVVGAGGQAGWDEAARSNPDGYTWVNYNLPQVVIQPAVRQTVYKLESLEPIVLYRDDPSVLAVRKDDPITLKDLIERARKEPGKVPVAVTGKWTQHHLTFLFLEAAEKVKFGEVNVDGQAEVNRLLLGGHVAAGLGNSSAFYRMQEKTRVLAVAAKKRMSTLPNAQTFEEQGVKGVLSSVIMGLAVAKGTNPELLKQISGRVYKMFQTNEALKQDLEKAGVTPAVLDRDASIKLVAESRSAILDALKQHGIKVRE